MTSDSNDQVKRFFKGDGFTVPANDIEAEIAGRRDFGFIYVETDHACRFIGEPPVDPTFGAVLPVVACISRRPDIQNPAARRHADDQGMGIPDDTNGGIEMDTTADSHELIPLFSRGGPTKV